MINKLLMGLILSVTVLEPVFVSAQEEDIGLEEGATEEKKITVATEGLLGNITIGGGLADLDNKSAKHGEYTGLDDDSLYLVGDADLSYNKGGAYLDLRASNIGLDNRNVYLEGGRYGEYRMFLEYDQIPHLLSDNSKTPFDGAGGSVLSLPASFSRGVNTSAMTGLSSSTKDVDLELERKAGTAGFAVSLGKGLILNGSFKREEKEGKKSLGATIGFSGAVVLPEPVDYTTDELRATLSYNGKAAQAEVGYNLSTFDNHDDSLRWDNPYSNNPASGKNSLPPDNRYQKISFSGGVDLPYASRLSAVAEYGEMRQDETLLPYTNNTVQASTPLPRDSADAEINTTHLMLNLASRPLPKLGLDARYRYYKTKNETTRDLFQYVPYDSAGTSQASISDAGALYNLPYDYIQNQFKIDASYYLLKGTTLKAGYDRDVIDRDYREAARTAEDTYKIKLVTRAIPSTFAILDYSHAERGIDGSYDGSRVYDYYHTNDYISSIPSAERFDNHPDLRKFDVAERDRDKYGAKVTVFSAYNSSLSFNFSHIVDDYNDSSLGLTNSQNNVYTIDFSITPVKAATIYAFYTREELSYDIEGSEFTSTVTNSSFDWKADNDNDINTAGIGAVTDFLKKKLVVSADYSYSVSEGSIEFTGGSSIPATTDMSDLKTYLHKFKVAGKYKVTENLTAGAGFEVEKYSSDDWSTDGIDPASTTVSNLLTLSGSIDNYEAHKGVVYLSYNF